MEQVILIFVRELGRVVLDFKIRDYLASLFLKLISMPKELIRNFFGQEEKNFGDLMKINPDDLPHFDLMIAGFPCQSFSVIGQRKGMCDYRGQIIYGLIKIMNGKNLPYFI